LETEDKPGLKWRKGRLFYCGFAPDYKDFKKQKRQHRAGAFVIIN